jgi:ferric-dicitrate binding protein FerR (iron transport regulator)
MVLDLEFVGRMREVSQLRQVLRVGALVAFAAGLASAQFPGVGAQASPDSAAKVASLTGQVSVLKGSEPWALNTGDLVYPKQIVVSGSDGFAIFQVSDGTTFEIYPNSRVTFRSNPGSWADLLDLWLGRVKVHVQRWGGQPNPNRIHTPTAVISVRGTTFDVALEGSESDTTWVAVEEGSVGVRHRLIPRSDEQVLNAGDELRVYRNAPLAKSKIDKGAIAKETLNTLADVFYRVMAQRGGFGGGTGGGVGSTGTGGGPTGGGPVGLPGDTGATAPSAPPPPLPGDSGASAPPPPPPAP